MAIYFQIVVLRFSFDTNHLGTQSVLPLRLVALEWHCLRRLHLFLKLSVFSFLENDLVADCQGHCGNWCSPTLDPQSQREEQREALITFKAHRGEHFCAYCARIPCSVGNMMDFVQTSALAGSHDMAGKLSISYCECHRSVPYLRFWLQNSWSHFMKQPTIQIGISCSAAWVPQLFALQRPPLQSPSSKQCIEGI